MSTTHSMNRQAQWQCPYCEREHANRKEADAHVAVCECNPRCRFNPIERLHEIHAQFTEPDVLDNR